HVADDRGVSERDRAGPARRASSRPMAGGTQHPRGGGDGMSAVGLLGAALLVGIGGGLGAVVRWGVSALGLRLVAAQGRDHLGETVRPGTTMLANLLACFLLGLVVARLGSAGGAEEF